MFEHSVFIVGGSLKVVRDTKFFFISRSENQGGRLLNVRRKIRSWKEKVHPVFLEIAAVYRDLTGAQKLSRTKESQRILAASAERRDELLEQRSDISPGAPCYQVTDFGYLPVSPEEKIERVFDWFFFKRNRFPRWLALERERNGDLEAHNQLSRAWDEFWVLLNGHGPVPPFKVNLEHSDLLELGLHLGLSDLSAEELADCFEHVCPCGKSHSADALKKQRARVVKDIVAASRQSMMYRLQKPAWERFAVYGGEEYVAKPYHQRDGMRYVEITQRGRGLQYVIYENGSISGFKNSRLSSLDVISYLPDVFFVQSLDEIFRMFFPGDLP